MSGILLDLSLNQLNQGDVNVSASFQLSKIMQSLLNGPILCRIQVHRSVLFLQNSILESDDQRVI